MKRYGIIMIMMTVFFNNVSSQEKLTLQECQARAIENYPLIKQYDLISKTERYTLSNISKTYLPQFSLNGQATYQSDVTKIPVDFAALNLPISIESMSKDQYKATIDITQTLWDGGIVGSQRKITKANSEVEKQQLAVSLYSVKDRVNQLYFGILAIDEQLSLLNLVEEDMQVNKKIMLSMLQNGTAMQSDLDQIDVELLNIDQNRTEQQSLREAYKKMLSLFIHQNISDNTVFDKPQDSDLMYGDINRPELSYYSSQYSLLDAQQNSITAKNMPHIGLFAQGGYGRPGLNMLERQFKLFAIGGIKLTWDFGNLYTKKNEKRIIDNNRNSVDIQQETFLFNTKLELTQEQSEIHKLKILLEKDDEIIQLRRRVKLAGESKYKNGVYQINDLIRDINAENQARQNKALREINYLLSIYNYKHIQGN